MKVLVTGVKGQLGFDICKEFDARGIDNIGVGMCLGVGIGTCLGAAMDAANRKKTTEDTGSDEKNNQDPME